MRSVRLQVLVIEQQRGQRPAQMPLHVIRQQTQEQMRPDPRLRPVSDRTDLQVHRLERSEGPLDVRQVLVAAHHLGRRQPIVGFAGAQDIKAVQLRFAGDGFGPPRVLEAPVFDLQLEVLGHLVPVLDATHLLGDLRRQQRGLRPPRHLPGDLGQLFFRGRQQILPLAPPILGQNRVVADHQTFPRIGWGADLRQVALIKERELNRLSLHQLADRRMPQRRDPAQPRMPLQIPDPGLGQQAAVPHQHHPLEPEAMAQGFHLVGHRDRIPRIARIGLHGYRAARPIRHHPVDDDGPAPLAVPVVAVAHQRRGLALVVAAGKVVQDVVPFGQVPAGQLLLDAPLALKQPVHGLVQVVGIGVLQGELRGQGGGVPEPGGGQLGGGLQQALNDQGQDQVALPRRPGIDQGGEPEAPDDLEHDLDMAMGERAFDDEEFIGRHHGDVLEDEPEPLDLFRRPVGEVGDGAFADAFAFAPALPEEDGGAGVPVGDGVDVHGN